MNKKIEDVFDLPPMNNEVNSQYPTDQEEQSLGLDLSKMQEQLDIADKIDSALPMVRDLETLDSDMDNYAGQAMNAFKDLMDLGQNVEDRHAAGVFDVSSKIKTPFLYFIAVSINGIIESSPIKGFIVKKSDSNSFEP